MANLLNELLGLCTKITICFDQHRGEVWSQKIHIINIIPLPTWSVKPVGIYHTGTCQSSSLTTTKVFESNSPYQLD